MTTEHDRFTRALAWLKPIEGGWWPGNRKSDPNPTMRGITQRTYDAYRRAHGLPKQSVRLVTDREHDDIYFANYWRAAGCKTLHTPIWLVHFDAAVNHGVGNAMKLLRRLGAGTAEDYIELRRAFYRAIVAHDADMEPNLKGWLRRMDKLARAIKETP